HPRGASRWGHRAPDLARDERARGARGRGPLPARGHRALPRHARHGPLPDGRAAARARRRQADERRGEGRSRVRRPRARPAAGPGRGGVVSTALKVMKYAFFDLLRSRWLIAYTALDRKSTRLNSVT